MISPNHISSFIMMHHKQNQTSYKQLHPLYHNDLSNMDDAFTKLSVINSYLHNMSVRDNINLNYNHSNLKYINI
jgi:hypothetical protein